MKKRAQILRLHARGVPAAEICARLLVSWQVVERVIAENALATQGADVQDEDAAEVGPPPQPEPAPITGEAERAPRGVVATSAPVMRKGRRPRRAARISDAEQARRDAMVDEAVASGRVTKVAVGAALGWTPSWLRTGA